jgi:hypothetical protein
MGISLWHLVVVSLLLSVPAVIVSTIAFALLGRRLREVERLAAALALPDARRQE